MLRFTKCNGWAFGATLNSVAFGSTRFCQICVMGFSFCGHMGNNAFIARGLRADGRWLLPGTGAVREQAVIESRQGHFFAALKVQLQWPTTHEAPSGKSPARAPPPPSQGEGVAGFDFAAIGATVDRVKPSSMRLEACSWRACSRLSKISVDGVSEHCPLWEALASYLEGRASSRH